MSQVFDVVPQSVAEPPRPGGKRWTEHAPRALFSGSIEDCQNYLAAHGHAGARILQHICPQGETWIEYDARGIPLCKVCDACRQSKLSKYRPEVLTNPNYDTYGERIDEDDY